MYDPNSPSLHGWNQPQNFGGGIYPGLGDPSVSPPALVNPKILPAQGAAKTGLMSNLGEWKQMLDRMGGIDGVMSTVGKVQKFVVSLQQMAPLLRIFLKKGAATATKSSPGKAGRGKRRVRRQGTRKSSVRSRRRPRSHR